MATLERLPDHLPYGSNSAMSTHDSDEATRPLTDVDILTSIPPPLLRLLVLLAPLLNTAASIVRLASWTAGPHSAPASILLLCSWWAICTLAYPLLRYAPQVVPLSLIAYHFLRLHLGPVRSKSRHSSSSKPNKRSLSAVVGDDSVSLTSTSTISGRHDVSVHNAHTLSLTLSHIEELADFTSTLAHLVLRPFQSLLDWSDPSATLATLSFLLVTYPLYLLCFLPWDALGLPTVRLVFPTASLIALGRSAVQASLHLIVRGHALARHFLAQGEVGRQFLTHVDALLATGTQHWQTLLSSPFVVHTTSVASTVYARIVALGLHLSVLPSRSALGGILLPLVPPYPFFSLTTSSALFWIGTLVLTYSSPFAALLRHALWRSSLVRYVSRKSLSALTLGHWDYVDEEGKQRMRHYSLLGVWNAASEPRVDRSVSRSVAADAKAGAKATGTVTKKGTEALVERHEDVVYQFSIFENQRWWMGLDWTAALLPQERPSWSDEHNHAVSPPTSFSLPSAKTTLTATPTSEYPKAHMRRVVQWHWIDPEWTVAGAGFITAEDATSSSQPSASSAIASNLSETLRGRFGGSDATPRSPGSIVTATANGSNDNDDALDVDPDGWQYGDNAWDKMSKKSGLGRYTRRRKWVRRAALVERVERGYTPNDEEMQALKRQAAA